MALLKYCMYGNIYGGEIFCDPGWRVHKSDVQNKLDDKTHITSSGEKSERYINLGEVI